LTFELWIFKMKSLTPFLISLLVAGSEPFWPFGSPSIALAAVLGTKYPNSLGLIIAILIGLVRDVLLVNRLGISSLVTALAWFVAAAGVARLGRPVMISVGAALAGEALAKAATPAGFFTGPLNYQSILATAALAALFAAVWGWIAEKDEKIRVRKI
jgi:hypothetical protein